MIGFILDIYDYVKIPSSHGLLNYAFVVKRFWKKFQSLYKL